jgi:hypothetical protein
MNDYENSENQDLTDQQDLKEQTEKATNELTTYIDIGKKDKQSKIFNKQDKDVYKTLIQFYIINRQWVKKWKDYVKFQSYKSRQKFPYYYNQVKTTPPPIDPKLHPGPIDNQSLLVPFNEFLNDGDENNPENQVIKGDLNEREHLKIISKDRWQLFFESYGGGPTIIKQQISEGTGYQTRKVVELYDRKVRILSYLA